jgi:antitoxin component YwqK of YwqJK toxin-antitoxin module
MSYRIDINDITNTNTDAKNGTYYYYNENELFLIENYMDGKLHGHMYTFYDSGYQEMTIHFQHNEKHGEELTYYEAGCIKSRINYINGRRTSETHYNEHGYIIKVLG